MEIAEEDQACSTSSPMREDLGQSSTLRVRGGTAAEQGSFSRGLLSPRLTLANFCQGASGLGLGPSCLVRQLGEGTLG